MYQGPNTETAAFAATDHEEPICREANSDWAMICLMLNI
jgi:hypothetical protein